MDRLEAMSVLLAAVEAGSLSGAGRRLGMPLASVSRKVSDLEKHLKTRLINRSTRRFSLTDAGRSYIAACKRILEEVDEAERVAAGEYSAPKGDLAITAPIVFGRLHVLPIVSEFLKAYPDINIRLHLTDRTVDLMEERIDLAVRIGELPDSGLVATRLGLIRRVVCASPGYLAGRGRPERPDDLREHDCVTFEGLLPLAAWIFAVAKSERTVPVRSRLVVNTAEAALDAAAAGVGITRVLSYQMEKLAGEGLLVPLLQDFEPAPWPVSLVHAGQAPLAGKLRAFLDFAVPRLRTRLA